MICTHALINSRTPYDYLTYTTTTLKQGGVDNGSITWHNDAKEKGLNASLFIYLDRMNQDTLGALYIKGPLGEHTIYPDTGLVVLINQSSNFVHKADKPKSLRRMIGYDLFII